METSLKLGAWVTAKGVHFLLWAPKCQSIEVLIEGKGAFALQKKEKGYFSGLFPQARPGDLYKFRINAKDAFPDPCSRFQPQGPHGPSMIIDSQYEWHDEIWQSKGIDLKGQVIYELHVGTFSKEGSYDGLIKELKELKDLGITSLEIMPLNEFSGRWNWGYDGVDLFAPAHVYGAPNDLKRLIDEAHQIGLGVILDVVYNHFGPDGNYMRQFSDDYFTDRYKNEWGDPINFDGPNSKEVREFFIQNACYWIEEYHFDGLRFDATQNIYDSGDLHILAEMAKTLRETAAPKKLLLIGENESQQVQMLKDLGEGGNGLNALWNDDFHHSARVSMTGRREAYYTDYLGKPQEFISLIKHGYLYQGQFYSWQKQNRGTLIMDEIPAAAFVTYLQNHDQIANSFDGTRIDRLTSPGIFRVLTALLLLSPQTPLLFMGQEFASSAPFLYFADHNDDLAPKVAQGRKEFLSQFPSIKPVVDHLLDPRDPKTHERCKLNFKERHTHKEIYQLHKDLLRLRQSDEVISLQDRSRIEGAVLGDESFLLRYKGNGSDRLLIVNLGCDLLFSPCPQPLLAPLPGKSWTMIWSSDQISYGGKGTFPAFDGQNWRIPGCCAQVFHS